MVVPGDFTVPCQAIKIPEGVPHWMRFIGVDRTEDSAYHEDPDAHNNKAHVLVYLNSKHWNEGKEKRAAVFSTSTGTGANRTKTTQIRKYNRMAFFADCLQPGRVCCKVTNTHHDSVKFFTHMIHGGYGVGWVYIFEE